GIDPVQALAGRREQALVLVEAQRPGRALELQAELANGEGALGAPEFRGHDALPSDIAKVSALSLITCLYLPLTSTSTADRNGLFHHPSPGDGAGPLGRRPGVPHRRGQGHRLA